MVRGSNSEQELLEARLMDAIEKSEKGMIAYIPFLTPGERRRAEGILRHAGVYEQACFFGGYAEAERVCLFLAPSYLTELLSLPISECPREELDALFGETVSDAVCAVRIKGSGFRTLTHRDYLGAVLGLGIERDALGDLAVQEDGSAVLFCSRTLADFLRETLCKVGSDTVRCTDYVPDGTFTDGRHYQPISDTVASARLDCVVAALCNLSREAAQSAIRAGTVEVDYESVERTDFSLTAPATIAVRGYGKFILRAFDGETRKGRLRLRADRLI